MPCECRSLSGADLPALIAETAARLKHGELCVLPTETVYGLAVLPSHKGAVARARALKGRSSDQPFTWHLAQRKDLQRIVGKPDLRVRRLLDRYWPGPLTVILKAKNGETVGLRQPAHAFTRSVIAACGEPLWLSSVNRTGEPPLLAATEIAEQFGGDIDLVIDDGPSPLGMASTIVRATTPNLEVLREGILTTADVLRTAADLHLFVCTGNTCRSPLAEALARDLVAQQLGIAVEQVLARGLAFGSAGTSTMDGMPASEGSVLVGAELGLDLTGHMSRAIDRDLVRAADRIYCLSDSHRRAILAEFPEAAEKVGLLRPDQLDIADPYGGETEVYRRVRDEIRAVIGARLGDWVAV